MSEMHETKSFRIDYRHLAFFFLGAVCVCAVFFALGFVVGRAQAFETALKDQEEQTNTANDAARAASEPANALPVAGKESEPSVATASAGKAVDASPEAPGVDYRKDLDFYSAVKETTVDQNFHPESPKPHKSTADEKKSKEQSESRSASTPARNGGRGTGGVSLQVAALRSAADADRLAKTLKSRGYPVFIVNPGKDDPTKLIRVQIGPYTSDAEAAKIKTRLGAEGYTAISKR
jgi:cell division septation protein DedD